MKQEDYLETIYNLQKKLGYVRLSDVAKELQLSKPSVTQMMQRLEKDGCAIYRPYSPLKLTTKGRKIGKQIADRHQVLAEFFTLLNIPKKTQEKDIHGIEHHLSKTTLEQLKKVTKFLRKKNYPEE